MLTPEPPIPEEDTAPGQELKVTFFPELFLQRRMWILNVLRKENITQVLDVGCGEGQLLTVLCQPAPWLTPPPASVLPPAPSPSQSPVEPPTPSPMSPTYNDDEIPNLHPTLVHGLDISAADLAFAVQGTAPPQQQVGGGGGEGEGQGGEAFRSYYNGAGERWEDLVVKIWQGGLEVVNKEFVDIECVVSTEVIEHLPPPLFPFFAPTLLGAYHPRFLLLTTPSYTYNARFTAPHAPPTARQGFLDPTHRTARVFRHEDHHFEWTAPEFRAWCAEEARAWGYTAEVGSVGRALEKDPYGREEELGGATGWAIFRRIEGGSVDNEERERKARDVLEKLERPGEGPQLHTLLTTHTHPAHPLAQHPAPLPAIAAAVKAKMESFREAFMRIEELWFERDIAVLCGGWIELLVRAVEEGEELGIGWEGEEGVGEGHGQGKGKGARTMWTVQLLGGVSNPRRLWPTDEEEEEGEWDADKSADLMPPEDWTPGEGSYPSSEDDSTEGAEGDISWGPSEEDDGDVEDELASGGGSGGTESPWGNHPEIAGGWGASSNANAAWAGEESWGKPGERGWGRMPSSSGSSTAGWDGDEDESDATTG